MKTFLWILSILTAIMAPFINARRSQIDYGNGGTPPPDDPFYNPGGATYNPANPDQAPPAGGNYDPGAPLGTPGNYTPSPLDPNGSPLPYCPDPLSTTCEGHDYERQIDLTSALRKVNQYRTSKGRSAVLLNEQLIMAADAHARDLARHDRISHYGSDGSDPAARVARTGYHAGLVAENVGTGQKTFDEVLQGWKDSPGHNENLLLKDAREIGMALVTRPDGEFKTFWVQVFGTSIKDWHH